MNGCNARRMAVVPVYGLIINFPRVATGGGFGGFGGQASPTDFNEAVKRRDQSVEDLKKIFKNAETYLRARDAYAKDNKLPYPPNDPRMEAMAPYIRGERPIIFTSERERDIRAIAKFVSEMRVKGIVMGGQEAWKAADVLKANKHSGHLSNIYSLPVRDDDPSIPFRSSVKDAGRRRKILHLDR